MGRRHNLALLATISTLAWSTSGFPQSTERDAASDPGYNYEPPPSRWIGADKARAREVLAGRRYNILIVPFQVEGHALDVISRGLMTRSLSDRIARSGELSVADATLVERAFGGVRMIANEDAFDLAEAVGAELVVLGYVGHDEMGHYTLRVEAVEADAGGVRPESRRTVAMYEAVPFSDTELPYFSFVSRLDEIVNQLPGESSASGQPSLDGAHDPFDLPGSLADIRRINAQSRLDAAGLLQFLGVLHPDRGGSRVQERLFERSLILLEGVNEDSPDYRLLKARALLHLHRRPAALAALGVPNNASEQALRAYLDGDIEAFTAALPGIASPLLSKIAAIEYQRLRISYGDPPSEDDLEQLIAGYEFWAPEIYQAVAASSAWRHYTHAIIKLALDVQLPIGRFDLQAYVTGKSATGDVPSEYEIAQLVIQHIRALEDEHYATWLAQRPRALDLYEADLVDWVQAMLLANVADEIQYTADQLGQPDRALELARRYEPLLADEPGFTIVTGWTAFELSGDSQEPEKSNLESTGYELLRRGTVWSQGQTRHSDRVAAFAQQFFPGSEQLSDDERAQRFYGSDWPRRPWSDWLAQRTEADREASLRDCVAYTLTTFQCMIELHDLLIYAQTDRSSEAEQLLADNEHRFVGHPQRLRFFSGLERESGDEDAADAQLREAIAAGSTDWDPYMRLAIELIRAARPQEALKIVLRYPLFREDPPRRAVALSNRAYEAGSWFYWAGDYEAARPLYEIAAGYRTGSAASITSAVRLALMDGDYETALFETSNRARRYGSAYAYRDLMSLLHLFGEHDTAWAVMTNLQDLFTSPQVWTGAFVGHRIAAASPDEIMTWALEPGRSTARSEWNVYLPLRYYFMTQIIDREIATSVPEALEEYDPNPRAVINEWGVPEINGEYIYRSKYFEDLFPRPTRSVRRQPVQTIEGRYTLIARALLALQNRDYALAYETLDRALQFYDIREFLPYYAWASVKAGETERIESYLARSIPDKDETIRTALSTVGIKFDDFLASAFLDGGRGDHESAIDSLIKANADILHTESRHIFTRYQVIEAAELLYEDTGETAYKTFALDLARRNAIIEPVNSWAHAFVAKLTDDPVERRTALTRALYLDPFSRRALALDPAEVEAAREAASRGYPLPNKSQQGI